MISSEEQTKLLALARENYAKTIELYNQSDYYSKYSSSTVWNNNTDNFRSLKNIINSSLTPLEAIHRVQRTYCFSIDPDSSMGQIEWHLNFCKSKNIEIFKLDEEMQSSDVSTNTHIINGRRYSPDFFRMMYFYTQIKKYCEVKDNSIFLELGGGYGHFARTRKLILKNSVNILTDMPETLFFAYLFICMCFPDAKILYVNSDKPLNEFQIREYDFIFIPTMFITVIQGQHIDFFANTASMGEMCNSVIEFWIDFIQTKIDLKYLFCWNRYLNIHNRSNENECSVIYDEHWKVLNWQLETDYSKCPYEEPKHSRYLELVLERDYSMTKQQCIDRSNKLVVDVRGEDWHLYPGRHGVGSYLFGEISPDLSINGSLFRLWESLRLNKNKEAVQLMLKYLQTLKRLSDDFEETPYYEKLLNSL